MDRKWTVIPRLLKVVLVLLAGLGAVLTVLGLLGLVIWVLPPQLIQGQLAKNTKITDADRLKAINDVRGALLTGLGVLAVFSGSLVAYLNFRGTLELNRRGQVTDRFGKAIDQLGQSGSEKLDVRIGGIYALEQIARDSPELHWPIVEILTSFIREHAKVAARGEPGAEERESDRIASNLRVAADIQAALTVLGRRHSSRDRGRLDLGGANLQGALLGGASLQGADLREAGLQGADVFGANLQGAFLFGANLQGANLLEASLQAANLSGANLQRARLSGTNLQGARLSDANLQGALLVGANLQRAELDGADLQGAELDGADLRGAYLVEANLRGAYLVEANLQGALLVGANLQGAVGLTQEQLDSAECDEETKLPPGLTITVRRGVEPNVDEGETDRSE